MAISIHAPRAGSDVTRVRPSRRPRRFQSTLPVRGATALWLWNRQPESISIHAPRAGSDYNRLFHQYKTGDFNPRSPCGERHLRSTATVNDVTISIHAPRAGSDGITDIVIEEATISIHAPRAGSDHFSARRLPNCNDFNPRSPCGERRLLFQGQRRFHTYFNPRSPCGERRCAAESVKSATIFQSTLPVRGATSLTVPPACE